MEEQKPSLMKSALTWGIILGIALIIYSMLMWFLDLSLEKWVSWVSYVIMIGGVILATISYRDNSLNGTMTYGQALGFGVLMLLFASIISAIYSYIFLSFIDPGFIDKILQMTEEQLIEKGMSDDQIDMAIEMQRKFMKPIIMALMSIPSYTFMGLIISLITSIFLKKKAAEISFDE